MIRPLCLAALAALLPAAELVMRDLRLGLGTRPTDFDFTYSSPNTSGSGSDGFDAGLGIEVGGRWSFARVGDPLGLVVGADLMVDGLGYGGGDGLATTWLRLGAGPGWAFADSWTLSAEAGVQYGQSVLALPATQAAPEFSASGTSTGYDLRLNLGWMATRRFGLSACAGWLISSHSLDGDASITIDQSGWFVGAAAVWRFSDVPERLE